MTFLRSIIATIIVSLVLAMGLRFAGIGWPIGISFGLFLCLILPLVVYYYITREERDKDGKLVNPALASPLLGKVVITVTYLLLISTWFPVFKAMYYGYQPLTYKAAYKLIVRNDAVTALYMNPVDTFLYIMSAEQQNKQSNADALLMAEELSQIPDVPPAHLSLEEKRAFNEESRRKRAETIKFYGSKVAATKEINPGIISESQELDQRSGLSNNMWSAWLNPYPYLVDPSGMPWFQLVLYLYMVALLINAAFQLFAASTVTGDKRGERFRRAGKSIAWAIAIAIFFPVIVTEVAHWTRERTTVTASAPPIQISYASRKPDCIDDGQLSLNHPWVDTGYTLDVGQVAEIRIKRDEYTLYHPDILDGQKRIIRHRPEGFTKAEVPFSLQGPRMCDECDKWNLLAVIAKIQDNRKPVNPPILIGDGAAVSADRDGVGRIMLSVNQVIRKPHHNLFADNEWAMLAGEICYDIAIKSSVPRG